ncbi:MAG: hypothetical protein IPI83_07720 [Sphingomonadales bacterium]|nr:hypothetical protein [Sphingomonadales bacterium]
MSMFKNGKDCSGHCAPCALSTRYKLGLIRQQSAVSFVSPSRANLESLSRHFPVKDYPHAVILNPNTSRPTEDARKATICVSCTPAEFTIPGRRNAAGYRRRRGIGA